MSRQFATNVTTIYDIFCPVPFLPSPFGFRRFSFASSPLQGSSKKERTRSSTYLNFLLQENQKGRVVVDVWEEDVWEFQAKSGSSGSCRLFLDFLGKITVREMSGKTPGSPRYPSSRHPRPSEKRATTTTTAFLSGTSGGHLGGRPGSQKLRAGHGNFGKTSIWAWTPMIRTCGRP